MSHAIVTPQQGVYFVTCPCGEDMAHPESSGIRAAAQANRLEEYIERVGECHHGVRFPEAPISGKDNHV